MKKIIYITILFFSLISFGQTPINKVIFYDSIGKEIQSNKYYSKKVIKEFNIEKTSYEVDFFVNIESKDVLKVKYYVSDKNKLIKNGEEIHYYDNGTIEEIRNYDNGELLGQIKKWNENSKLYFEGEYKLHNEKPTLFYLNYWDKNNIQRLTNGNGYFEVFHGKNDEITFSGKIKNGLKDGIWKSNSTEYPRNEEIFKNGSLIKGTIFKSENTSRNYYSYEVDASPIGGVNEFRIKLANNIQKIKSSINFKGRAIIKFVVNQKGELVDFKNVDGIDEVSFNKLVDIIKKQQHGNLQL